MTDLHNVYTYDPLDRCIACARADEPVQQRFYQTARLVTVIKGMEPSRLFKSGDQLLAQIDNTGTMLLATDLPNTVQSVLKDKQLAHMSCTPYGYSIAMEGLSGFNGELLDRVTGHYLLGNGHRAYNPVLRRFNSPDTLSPFGQGGINAYAYCSGDPVNWHDSTGRFRLPIKKLSVIGGAVGVLLTEKMSSIKKVADITMNSLTRSPTNPDLVSPGRALLDEGLDGMASDQSFINLLRDTNKNLMSNADMHLSEPHARFYLDTAKKVDSGILSNTSAHFRSSFHWATQTQGPSRPVGFIFNALAGFIAAANDQLQIKTGRALQQMSKSVRS